MGVHVLGMLHVLAFDTACQTIIIRCILSMYYCMSREEAGPSSICHVCFVVDLGL